MNQNPATTYKLHVCPSDPYANLIERFIVREFAPLVKTDRCTLLDLITEAIISSGQVRYGPVPSPEAQVAIRDVIRHWMEQSRPIPFLIAWGSEKPSGEGIDIAELCALKTLASLHRRVKEHYAPGVQLNIRIEDVSAPHLFFERMEDARREAALYTTGFVNLIRVLDMTNFVKPVPETTLISENSFNALADSILPTMAAHVILPEDPEPTNKLAEFNWTPITNETVEWYLSCYEKLYPTATKTERLHRIARYFAGALARKKAGISGNETDWGKNFLELSFLSSSPPGVTANRFTRRIYYRTMPSSITNSHMPPWRCKGFLRIGKSDVTAALANYRTVQEYNRFSIELEKDGLKQPVQADYIVT